MGLHAHRYVVATVPLSLAPGVCLFCRQLGLHMGLTNEQLVMYGLPIRPVFNKKLPSKHALRKKLVSSNTHSLRAGQLHLLPVLLWRSCVSGSFEHLLANAFVAHASMAAHHACTGSMAYQRLASCTCSVLVYQVMQQPHLQYLLFACPCFGPCCPCLAGSAAEQAGHPAGWWWGGHGQAAGHCAAAGRKAAGQGTGSYRLHHSVKQ